MARPPQYDIYPAADHEMRTLQLERSSPRTSLSCLPRVLGCYREASSDKPIRPLGPVVRGPRNRIFAQGNRRPGGSQLFYQRGGSAQRLGGSTYARAEAAVCFAGEDQIINPHHEGIATNT